jgi:hypothetical protein
MFWSEIGNEVKIERAGMDGSERRVVVSHSLSLSWPGGLAVDTLGERIYWTDEKLRCIGSANLDGGDIEVLQKWVCIRRDQTCIACCCMPRCMKLNPHGLDTLDPSNSTLALEASYTAFLIVLL